MNILLIEDDAGLVELITTMLEGVGYSVRIAESGDEALTQIKKQKPNLMLLDYSLPDMNGKELIETLNNDNISIPSFILTTGQGDERIAVDMMKLGAKDYLVKDMLFLERLPNVVERVVKEIENEIKLKQIEKKIADTLEISSMAEKAANLGSWRWKLSNNEVVWSDNLCRLHGIEPEEFDGGFEQARGFQHPDDEQYVTQEIESMLNEKESRLFEYRIITHKGIVKWVEGTNQLIFDEKGDIEMLVGTVQDITEKKLSEIELQKQEQKFQSIAKNAPVGIFITDVDGRTTYWNQRLCYSNININNFIIL